MSQHSPLEGPALAAEGVSIAYGRTTIVRDLHLALPRGAFTVLVGPNGSGKSTILRSLARLLTTRGGTILLDGASIASLPSKELARRIGVLSQSPTAPEGLTVRDLVQQGRYPHRALFGRWSRRDEDACDQAMALTGMHAFEDRPLDSMSGGERQRAWIAMALAQETDILLLDEPTTFLDLAHQLEILDLVADLVHERGKTVVAVLHDLNQAARYGDHMVLLKTGSVVATGSPAEVMTAEAIADVFGVAARVIRDPVTGTPMCVPAGREGRRGGNGAG
jgi:iron complex transport system ATP-binding protein